MRAALAASCAEWTAEYATYGIFEALVPRVSSRSSGSAPDAVVELGGVVSSGMRASVAKRCVVVGEKARAARAKTGSWRLENRFLPGPNYIPHDA